MEGEKKRSRFECEIYVNSLMQSVKIINNNATVLYSSYRNVQKSANQQAVTYDIEI